MRNIPLVLVMALVVLTGAAGATAARAQDDELQRAVELLDSGRPQEAIEALDAILADNPDDWRAHLHRGRALGMSGDNRAAREEFLRVAEINPLVVDAYNMAFVASYQLQDYDDAWSYLVRAHQGGLDMGRAIQALEQVSERPADLEARLSAPRVFVDSQVDAADLFARADNPFTEDPRVGAAAGGGESEAGGVSAEESTPSDRRDLPDERTSGSQVLGQLQADFAEVVRQARGQVSASQRLGLAMRPEAAEYVLRLEADDVGEGERRPLRGFVKLLDASTGEEVYRRTLELRDVSSVPTIRADLERYVDYLEEWAAERE